MWCCRELLWSFLSAKPMVWVTLCSTSWSASATVPFAVNTFGLLHPSSHLEPQALHFK